MKKYALISLLMLACLVLTGQTIESVRATDSGKRSSRVVIQLSDATRPAVSSSGNSLYLRFQDTSLGTSTAQYRRLSHIIDTISLNEDQSGSGVTIRTMGSFQINHRVEGSRVIVDIVNPEIPETAQNTAQESSSSSRRLRRPSPATPSSTPPVLSDSLASRDSLKLAIPLPSLPPVPRTPWTESLREAVVANCMLLRILLGLALLLLLFAWYHHFASRRAPRLKAPKLPKEKPLKEPKAKPAKAPKTIKEKKKLDLGLDGATLIMDSDTKIRMVTKLLEEGWNSRQIAREMKIPVREIEEIVKRAQVTDH
ncbi:MAG: hypothetical protein V3576_05775 [Candidatus Cloacimonadota bacterium]